MRHILTAGIFIAGLTMAQAQTITPGIGGVAVTGQSGAGLYIPYGGGGVTVGAPGIGSYQLNGGGYTSPYSWNQFSNPTAYNFNTGGFNYNSGVYSSGWNNGWNGGLTTASYYGNPYSNGNVILNSGYNTYPSNYGYNSYPSNYGYNTYPQYGTSFGSGFGSSVTTPFIYTNGSGRLRGRGR